MKQARTRLTTGVIGAVTSVFLLLGCGGSKGPTQPPADTTYHIDIRYYGPEPSAAVRAAFDAATTRIQSIITADLVATNVNNVNLAPDSVCGVPGTTLNETVDDLVIYATIKVIDGVGKVQASSGPCLVRSSNHLPAVGRMEMDVDDLNALASSGRLNAVVLHEMLHVIGFGTIWEELSPSRLTGANGADPRFTGPQAIDGCNAAGGASICAGGVPVENCTGINNCGTGTRDSHWRELTFRTELMTGFIENATTAMPLSAMTIQSLGDLGYSVSTATADAYKIPGTAIMQADESPEPHVVWEKTRRPSLQISADGSIVGKFVAR